MDNQPNQQLQVPQEIKTFLEGLLEDAGMNKLEPEMKEEMIKELFARLDSFINSAIVKNLPPEHLEEFIKMNEEKKPKEEIEKYLQEKMPNAQDVFTKAFMEFRSLYLGNVGVAKNAPAGNQNN